MLGYVLIVNGLPCVVQRCAKIALIAAMACHSGLVLAQTADSHEAPSPSALVAARELFREATADVDAGRFAAALEKFKRVSAVKETAQVRYNIGQCDEGLGRIGTALADYELAERLAAGDPKSAEVGGLARDRAADLRIRVPRLTLQSTKDPPPDLSVTLDGQRMPPASIGVALPVDPGHHVIAAVAAGHTAFNKDLDLKERGTATVSIEMGEAAPQPATGDKSAIDPPSTGMGVRRTIGFVTMGVGAALGITSLVFLTLHNSAASDLANELVADCGSDGKCPRSLPEDRAQSHQSKHDTASQTETFAIVFAAGALVALGVGAVLVLSPPAKAAPAAWLSPSAPGAPAGLSLNGIF